MCPNGRSACWRCGSRGRGVLFVAGLVAIASFLALRGGREGAMESTLAIGLTATVLAVMFKLGNAG